MLMKWAKNDPVSEKEINRNNAVYGIQKNRNPFIDYPGLEEYIWGNKTTVDFSYDNYDHTDGIHQMNNATIRVMKGTFNLQGLRIKSPARGLYIIDGKKVFVR